ncbi:MAG: hypothetical protein HFJ95_08065 [Muribaculaceae bacterium]|nr:hypothetical protein [Muribaculaceae bacterium]
MRHWILLILFTAGLLINLKSYFWPEKVDSTQDPELAARYMATGKRYSSLSAILFLLLVLNQITDLVPAE